MAQLERIFDYLCSETLQIIIPLSFLSPLLKRLCRLRPNEVSGEICFTMKVIKLLTAAAIILSCMTAKAQELVIRIDDMGALHSVNVASIDTYQNGIAKSVEVLAVGSWFPEAVKMLKENPGLDVGVHLAITSEWENVKWRPLTHCPSLVDENGYFYPMMGPNPAYPGQSVMEQMSGFDIEEIEKEFRAQIELTLKNIPQITHISGHMYSTAFSPEVIAVVKKLSEEYNLPSIDRAEAFEQYDFTYTGYDGPKATYKEKVSSFIKALDKMEEGRRYMFVDHPAYNDSEMQTVMHIGYEDVAVDRQGVTDLLKSPEVMKAIEDRGIKLIDINLLTKSLPRAEASAKMVKAADKYLAAVDKADQNLHSIMVVKDGNVIFEKWMSEGTAEKPHILNSVSKTFTSMAVGLAISEGKLSLEDKLVDIFPEYCPENPSEYLKEVNVEHLLTMNCGHSTDPTYASRTNMEVSWVKLFMEHPFTHKPGTIFCYNSLGTYVLSAIVQKVTGEKVADYLYPRLFRPLGINNVSWAESPEGINTGGWGLFLKTEDLAKMGLMILQKGQFGGRQVIPAEWIEAASAAQVPCVPAGLNSDQAHLMKKVIKTSDWLQGYGYQMWRCRYNAFRADGANGQYIIVIPDKNAVVVTTANIRDMQGEIDLIWKHIYPAL